MKKTIKSGLSLIVAAVMCMVMLPVTASAADSDFLIENNILIEYKGPGGHVVIPDGVTIIGQGSLSYNWRAGTEITSVTIPNSVKVIAEAAFSPCRFLTSVTIPDSVVIIGNNAFRGCTSLTEVTFGKNVASIGSYAFADCTALKSVTVPGSISVEMYSHDQYTLNNLTWDYGIFDSAFDGCTALEKVTIEHGVTMMRSNTFRDCTSLKTAEIPESVTYIGMASFHYSSDNINLFTLPNLTIHGKSGSYAETYAKQNNIPFVSTGGTATSDPDPQEPPKVAEKPSSWAERDVTTAISSSLVPQGLQEKYTQATTRAEFCALAVALYETVTGREITADRSVSFSDTTDINVLKMATLKVVNGVGDTKFAPNAGLTREQAATMLSRLADAIGKPLTKQAAAFDDNGSIASWAVEAVGQMQVTGIMGGTSTTAPIFDPQGAYTREQSIVTILRLYEIVK